MIDDTVKLVLHTVCQVNGRDMRQVSHQDAVKALISSNNEVVIEVSHDPQPPGLEVSCRDWVSQFPVARGILI